MRKVLLVLGVLILAAGANAQWRSFGDDDYNRGPYARGEGRGRADVVDRALRDLDSARSYRGGRSDWREMEKARKGLMRFQDNWYRGRFDKDRLDGAIEHLDRLARSRDVDPRDARILERDVWDLRSFREYRGDPRGYEDGWRRGPRW